METNRISFADRVRRYSSAGTSRRHISCGQGEVRLRDPDVFGPLALGACRDFLRRVFRLDEVRSVEVDQARASAVVHFVPAAGDDRPAFLARFAEALRTAPNRVDETEVGVLPPAGREGARFRFVRHGNFLSTWDVAHAMPGRIRFRNEAIRADLELAGRAERELAAVLGVTKVQANPLAASLLVEFDPRATTPWQLLRLLEGILAGTELATAAEGASPLLRFGLVNTAVVLAVIGDTMLPAVRPVSAAVLLYANIANLRAAWRQLGERRVGLPFVATAIVVLTLASNQFLAAALMGWMIKFWQSRYRRRLIEARQRLLPELMQHRRFAWLRTAGAVVEVPVNRIAPGDHVVVYAGEVVPLDGRVADGSAVVDERMVQGSSGLSLKGRGEVVFANSRVVEGELVLEVSEVFGATRALALERTLLAAASLSPGRFTMTAHGEAFAHRAVVPTLTAASLGLLVGDVTTAVAILRPDYATGPGAGVTLGLIEDIAASIRDGVLVREGAAFRRLAEADAILFDLHPELERRRVDVATAAFGAESEASILLYAAAASRGQSDARSRALFDAVAARQLVPLNVEPAHGQGGTSFVHGGRQIVVRDVSAGGDLTPLLDVSADGRSIGRLILRESRETEGARVFRDLQNRGAPRLGIVTDQARSDVETLFDAWNLDVLLADVAVDARAELFRRFRAQGLKVAYVCDGRRDAAAAREAHVAISVSGEIDCARDPAPIVLLRPELDRIGPLWDRARSHLAHVRTVHGSTLIPNLACVAGALTFGFTSMVTVVLTNLGTLSIYARNSGQPAAEKPGSAGPLSQGRVVRADRPAAAAGGHRRRI
jgi:cation transport ATPase